MVLAKVLAVALTCSVFVEGQYGPLKGSNTRRTTTPFPPGVLPENQVYNSVSNSLTPDGNQHSYSYSGPSAAGSGAFSSSSHGCGPGAGCGGAPVSGSAALGNSNQKTPAGAASFSDNPWLSGIVAQHSGSGSYQQSRPSGVPCTVPGHVCVQRHQCQGGYTSSPGSGNTQCDANTEVCCQYGQSQPGHQPQPSFQQPAQPGYGQPQQPRPQPGPTYQPTQPSQGPVHQPAPAYQPGQRPFPAPQPGPSFPAGRPSPGPGHQPAPTFQAGQRPQPVPQGPNYNAQPQTPHQPSFQPGTNGIPIGGSIYDSGRPGSSYVTPAYGPYTGPLNTTPHPGCAAALKCVEEIYCDAKGVMQDTPVQLTREEYENRVPLSECQNIETGIIGKCCRDPNYKDPWPDMNNGVFGDGHYHGDHGGGHHPQQHHPAPQQGQFFQQGTSPNTCGPSATCTPQSQCTGGGQIQPGKQCQVPQDGSTGVCCSKPPFPSFTNNHQVNPSPAPSTTTHRPTPGQQYYTPKPSVSNNPFLPENQGRLPLPQRPSQGPIHPTGISPVNYGPTQPNAIPEQTKDYEHGKQPTPKPQRPAFGTSPSPSVSNSFPRPAYPQSPQPPQPPVVAQQPYQPSVSHSQPSPTPSYSSPTPVGTQPSYSNPTVRPTYSVSQQTQPNPRPANLPVFPQIATASSVYTPRPDQPSTPKTNIYQQSSPSSPNFPTNIHQQAALGNANFHNVQSSGTVSTTLAPPVESNDIQPSRAPTKGRGPPGGYPFLAPTTEPNRRRPGQRPSGDTCGVRRDVQRPNGPNGLETGFGEFPWQVQVLDSSSQTPLCSGAILSNKVIVTAAHCVDDFKSEEVSVKAGDWKLATDSSDETKPAQIRQVAAISRHPKYDPVSRFYDMAVLVLSEPLQIDEHVNVLCLGDSTPEGQRPSGSNCVVTGWGKAALQSNTPGSTMHSIPVSFIESAQCEDTFRKTNLGKYFQLNKSFVCAVPTSPNDDLCQVDVGSPIACQKPDGRYELSGIYSWDVGCHQPVAASNVDKPWVQSVMNKPVEQVKQEEKQELEKKENLGFNPANSDLTKPGFSQGYGKK